MLHKLPQVLIILNDQYNNAVESGNRFNSPTCCTSISDSRIFLLFKIVFWPEGARGRRMPKFRADHPSVHDRPPPSTFGYGYDVPNRHNVQQDKGMQ